MNIQEVLDKRAGIHAQMGDLVERAKKEKRGMATDEHEQFDKMEVEYKALTKQWKDLEKEKAEAEEDKLSTAERLAKFEAQEAEQKSLISDNPIITRETAPKKVEHKKAMVSWMRRGFGGLTIPERNAIYEKKGTNTNIIGTDGLGGFLVPEEWDSQLVKGMEAYGGMFEVTRRVNTSHGRKMHINKIPFAGAGASGVQKGHRIAEDAADTIQDLNFTEAELDAYVYSSFGILITWDLIQDEAYNIESEVLEIGAERVGRIVNEELTTGTGSGQPNGVVTASALGVTAASATAITVDELITLEHSLNSAYRKGKNVRFMFADSTLALIKKFTVGTADDRPLWVPSRREGEPDRLLGYQYVINDDMPAATTGLKSVLFGDFDKYRVRKAGYAQMARSAERYIENRKTVFYIFGRWDGELVDGNAMKHLIQL